MKFFVAFFQMGARDVRIDLRRRDIGVAEHLLHRSDIRIVLNKMRRERVPKRMRRNVLQAAFGGVFLYK
jgi:hypothetical protein